MTYQFLGSPTQPQIDVRSKLKYQFDEGLTVRYRSFMVAKFEAFLCAEHVAVYNNPSRRLFLLRVPFLELCLWAKTRQLTKED